jgi:hypothetical protein
MKLSSEKLQLWEWKQNRWCWNTLYLAYAGSLHSSLLEMSSGLRTELFADLLQEDSVKASK